MSRVLNSEFVERLLFTAIVVGILMTLVGVVRFIDLSNQLSNNQAVQIRQRGDDVSPETTNEARGLMASDLERRRLVEDRFNMMVVGGIGLVLLSVGWIGTDLIKNRRKQDKQAPPQPITEVLS